ncbi:MULTISPECIES: hypothetical protein [unclassified Microcoleus]|uniref:hypothetical protein n=1 Tax=unclassified Microcoleus TaxID=2642155 RepID=UPI002FD64138
MPAGKQERGRSPFTEIRPLNLKVLCLNVSGDRALADIAEENRLFSARSAPQQWGNSKRHVWRSPERA